MFGVWAASSSVGPPGVTGNPPSHQQHDFALILMN